MLVKVVITAAGKGTRLLPFTKEIPKEMMPIFSRYGSKEKIVRPILEVIYEQLYSAGGRNFSIIIDKRKDAIRKYFTMDKKFLNELDKKQKRTILKFYQHLEKSKINWVNQKSQLGFGHAVKISERYVGKDDFIVHAGDAVIISKNRHPISRLIDIGKNDPEISAVILCKKVKDAKRYGVPEIEKSSKSYDIVKNVVEKPKKPKSDLGILPLYYFKDDIFNSLKKIKPGRLNEYQLTDAIQKLIENNKKVVAIKLQKNEYELDVGTVATLKSTQEISYKYG
ncbi:MAG: hypothetical protein CL420_02355 [Acidimicrobiaceae bacterium]|nr:hypothetical protein [Acidimicrobiaceae bacterium]